MEEKQSFLLFIQMYFISVICQQIYIYIYVCELHSNILILLIGGNERKGI